MANSRKSKSDPVERVANALSHVVPPGHSILLGLSGGMDSAVLLHMLHMLAPRFSWRLAALHVHHGISRNADAWASFCTGLCSRYGIPLHIEHVDITALRDEHGIEAAARQLRHAAFAKQGADFIALAQHADDQAETLLLQLLRGAGIKGVAAMPLVKPAGPYGRATVRPLLGIPRSVLLGYAQQHGLQWVEDESNADDSYPRNFLRHRLLPLLEQKFPAYRNTLTRSAHHFAEADGLLDELAQQDAQGWTGGAPLEVSLLRAISPARARNLLRYFLHRQGVPMPHDGQLGQMVQQLCNAQADAAVCIDSGAWQVRRFRDQVYALRALGNFDRNLVLPWQGESGVAWPALNIRLSFTKKTGQGISIEKLQRAPVTLRLRNGGEALRPYPNAATRSLKNLLQEYRVPPWQRERLPLLYCGEALACVVGVAVAADFQAAESEPGVVVA